MSDNNEIPTVTTNGDAQATVVTEAVSLQLKRDLRRRFLLRTTPIGNGNWGSVHWQDNDPTVQGNDGTKPKPGNAYKDIEKMLSFAEWLDQGG